MQKISAPHYFSRRLVSKSVHLYDLICSSFNKPLAAASVSNSPKARIADVRSSVTERGNLSHQHRQLAECLGQAPNQRQSRLCKCVRVALKCQAATYCLIADWLWERESIEIYRERPIVENKRADCFEQQANRWRERVTLSKKLPKV